MAPFGSVPYAEQGRYQSPYALTISDLILKRGDAQADQVRQGGQIAAQTIGNIGKSVTGALAERSQRMREAPRLAAEQQARELEIQQARGAIAGQQRAVADQGALDAAVNAGGDDPDAIEKQLPGHLRPVFRKSWNEAQTAKVALTKAQGEVQAALFDHVGAMAAAAKTMGAGHPDVLASLLADAKKAGDPEADRYAAALQQNPASADSILNALIQRSPTQTKIVGEGQDRTLRQQQEQRAILTQQQTAADREADNKRADALATETGRHNRVMEARPVAGAASGDEAEAIADAIIRGEQSPETTGLYRVGPQVRAQLAKKGYNQAQAITDWKATQKHISTLNGSQQTRMAQAVDNAAHSLDVIDSLASQWKAGGLPVLNKVKLTAAKQGVLGADAQKIAVALDAQIADVTSELGNVYMGGNSPTDHALGLAAKNLSADWSEATLKAMTTQARTNLQIRQNSMRNVGVAGASEGNAYAPKAPAQATPSANQPIKVGGFTVTVNP